MRLLVVEDDPVVAEFIVGGFTQEGFTVDHASDGKMGLFLATSEPYEVMIVDRMLPHLDGLKLIRTVRANEISTPILVLSALADVEERVRGLDAGADDYLVKPFAFSELRARVSVLSRRKGYAEIVSELRVGDLRLDLLSRRAERAGQSIDLLPREFRLLEYLMRHPGEVVTRTMLFEHVWDYHFDPGTNVIDVHISRLRRKVDRDFGSSLIHTIRGAGYVIRADQ